LYGSYVRRDFSSESDIDITAIVKERSAKLLLKQANIEIP